MIYIQVLTGQVYIAMREALIDQVMYFEVHSKTLEYSISGQHANC